MGSFWHHNNLVGIEGAVCFAFLWFVTRVVISLLFHFVPLVGHRGPARFLRFFFVFVFLVI